MTHRLLFPLAALLAMAAVAAHAAPQKTPELKPGVVLVASAKFKKGDHLLPGGTEDGDSGAVTIQGDNLTVDFGGATLRGTPATTEPDARKGCGIFVRGKNITIRNVRVHGYKLGLVARNAPGLKIENSDFSFNWKQHLKSTLEREDLSDWMSYHQNEKDEWLRYGAGIYLRGCPEFTVKGTRILGGQNGLLLMECDRGKVYNNDFSFLSSLGIGMYRSSSNTVMHNKIDWCVRGYSHGVYNRGQDSAGILIYEQSNKNTFAYNSVTHGGDGFFLWAGQSTMDTGKGGCNDNLLFGNDFSHAPTNGIEATFSRNLFANNFLLECWHGIWGGYSYETQVLGNVFGYNAQAIAWEHGQDNRIAGNLFYRDNEGIRLWANAQQDPNWGYPKNRDTRSRTWSIENNRFSNIATDAIDVSRTLGVVIADNSFTANGNVLTLAADATGITGNTNQVQAKTGPGMPAEIKNLLGSLMLAPEYAPLPPTMQPSGNPVLNTETNETAYRQRFEIEWNPRKADYPDAAKLAPKPLSDGQDPFIKKGALRGRRYILVDEWGPYDFKRPLLWPRAGATADAPNIKRFEILGPKGKWKVRELSPGVTLSATSGTVPGVVTVTLPGGGKAANVKIALEYMGGETTDYRGIPTPAGKPVPFGYEAFFAPIDWNIRFYTWEKEASDPRTQADAFAARLTGTPIATLKSDRLDFAGYKFAESVPANYFATVAEGTFEITPGDYTLEITTDDGMRATLDGKPLFTDAWKYQGPTTYTANVTLGGKHTLRVDHFQIDGYAALKVVLRPRRR
jgi:nitrous oxidase accessory protein NosD